ncbi:HPr family phosphocarrier protein [Lacrimispora sp.]|uniref:HPr family phosphocarrier protein n=1 Tax=Lacrimispora sp. TaxID=2719234 RepID=UPI003460B31E
MKIFHYTIREPYGIHARPAVMLAGESRKYNCKITVSCEGQTADASDMIAVMGLNIQFGDRIMMEFTGIEEDQAYNGMKDFLLNSQIF